MNRPKIAIGLNACWNLVNFRAGLVRALVANGFDVVVLAPPDKFVEQVSYLGCRYVPLIIDNNGTHPGRDLLLLWRFFRLLRKERPSAYLGYTVKPNIYGSMAAHLLGIPVVNNISGLGVTFIQEGWLNKLVKCLYRLALARSKMVFFQNNEDRILFTSEHLVADVVADCLPGSGVDLVKFAPIPLPCKKPIRFLLIARMLWDKGVGEFVDAARKLRFHGEEVEFCLLGFLNVQNPSAISLEQMNAWVDEGVIRYLGVSENIGEELAKADCVVLPSYREGTPRALLEAAAMGRPIITADSVGCREAVDDGVNGFLCRTKDATDLADKISKFIKLSSVERETMGLQGRKKMEQEFDQNIVISKYLVTLEKILQTTDFQGCPR